MGDKTDVTEVSLERLYQEIEDVGGRIQRNLKITNVGPPNVDYTSDAYFTVTDEGDVLITLTRTREGGRTNKIVAEIDEALFREVLAALLSVA